MIDYTANRFQVVLVHPGSAHENYGPAYFDPKRAFRRAREWTTVLDPYGYAYVREGRVDARGNVQPFHDYFEYEGRRDGPEPGKASRKGETHKTGSLATYGVGSRGGQRSPHEGF